jgi:hypothetical protein
VHGKLKLNRRGSRCYCELSDRIFQIVILRAMFFGFGVEEELSQISLFSQHQKNGNPLPELLLLVDGKEDLVLSATRHVEMVQKERHSSISMRNVHSINKRSPLWQTLPRICMSLILQQNSQVLIYKFSPLNVCRPSIPYRFGVVVDTTASPTHLANCIHLLIRYLRLPIVAFVSNTAISN